MFVGFPELARCDGRPEWPQVRKELRLSYAVQHGFDPGLWEPSEIVAKPEDKTFGSRLRNLGSALLSATA